MLMRALAGTGLVVAGFLMGVHAVRLASLAPYKRPLYAQRPAWRLLWGPARLAVVVVGLLLAAASSRTLAWILVVLLLAAWARRRWVGTNRFRKRLLRDAYVDLCRRDSGTPREELLFHLIQARHPRWDQEMIGQMIRDHESVEGLLDSLVRLERQVFE